MKRFAITTLALASLLATACTKDKETPKPAPTTEQMLSANTWHMTAVTANPGLQSNTGAIVTNIYPFIPSCTKDDTQQFVTGGQFRADEGVSKCDASDPQTVTGNWSTSKSGSDTSVNIVVNGSTLQFKLVSLNDSELKMSTTDDIFGIGTGSDVTYTLTYTK